jgi:hypothetical protein
VRAFDVHFNKQHTRDIAAGEGWAGAVRRAGRIRPGRRGCGYGLRGGDAALALRRRPSGRPEEAPKGEVPGPVHVRGHRAPVQGAAHAPRGQVLRLRARPAGRACRRDPSAVVDESVFTVS